MPSPADTDAWPEVTPADVDLDADLLEAAHHHLREHVPHLDSLLVIRHGALAFERYMRGMTPDRPHNLKSATKSVTSLLVGIALATGDLGGLDEPLGYILPELFTGIDDRAKREITIRDLLTMRSGLAWDEYGASAIAMTASPDWVRYVLERPLAHPPGTHFNYSTGDTQLLAAALQRLTGMSLSEYAALYLFGPLGITRYTWPADPQGVTIGGAELSLTPRDLARIGYLALRGGRWGDEALVPADWIADSHRPHVALGTSDSCAGLGYGYLWWVRPQAGYNSALAVGYGGQFAIVVPALDLLVVMTGDLSDVPPAFRNNQMLCGFNLVEDFIVPAALARA
ncbi:MAG: serine hydrolase [Anaerolineae bacterium]|nr:MAG: serine hydrolase [Anaerolineae bacterium]